METKEHSHCFLCDHKETQIYLFNNFKSALNRYERKYDSALKTLMNNIPSEVSELNADKTDMNVRVCCSEVADRKIQTPTTIDQELILLSRKEIQLQFSSLHAPSRRI